MQKPKITILGYSGAIGLTLSQELQRQEVFENLRLVSRSCQHSSQQNIEYFPADLNNDQQALEAIKDSDLVYLTVGLKYSTSIWEKNWLKLIENVIVACKESSAKLVFFDNVYMYGLNNMQNMTEENEMSPISLKGQVRLDMLKLLEEAIKDGLTVVIARSADFYGPRAKNSLFYISNIENLLKNKKPFWLGKDDKLHSFTYVPDAAKALVELGLKKIADNQVWHLPTSKALTGKEYMQIITNEFSKPNNYGKLNKLMLKFAGLFNQSAKELVEMFYQYEHDYVFHSDKFEAIFETKPTTYNKGITETVEFFRSDK